MGDVVNLRRARKARLRANAAQTAAENRVLHGRTRTEREVEASAAERQTLRHEGHKREGKD
jgi:hypothetical protein